MQQDGSDATASLEPRRVLELLTEQADLFARLEGLAGRQQAMVSGEAIEPLLAVLADRRRVSIRLAEIGTALEPIRRLWGEFRERFDPGARKEADQLVLTAERSLKRVLSGDERDVRILSARRRRVAGLLAGLNSAGSARTAYQPAGAATGRVDLVSEDA